MHVKYLSDGNQTMVKGFAAVYGTGDVLAPIRQCLLGEVTFAYGNGTSRFCGVVGNGLRGARLSRRFAHRRTLLSAMRRTRSLVVSMQIHWSA